MEARRTFRNHPDTTPEELAAWESWLWAVKHRAVTDEDRADLLPIIRGWMARRAIDPGRVAA